MGNANEESQDSERSLQRDSGRPPGLVVAAFTSLFVILLMGVYYDWWPFPRSIDFLASMAIFWLCIIGLIVLGIIWIIRSSQYIRNQKRWGWTIWVAPALVVGLIAIVFLFPHPTFDSARDSMEAVAHEVEKNPSEQLRAITIGGIDFESIDKREDGCIYFVDSDRSFISKVGWIYAPDCTPSARSFMQLTRLSNHWYEFEYGT